MIPDKYRNVTGGPVTFKQFSIVGAGSMVMPGITLQQGAAVGAMSLVTCEIPAWSVAFGIPATVKKQRNREMEKLVTEFKREWYTEH
jgi:acetyltransferase-like isoleucine patch superfamily enzyme